MDAAATAAGWLSFIVTAVGLGSLITQTNAIEERLDPYHTSRSSEHLGTWFSRQPKAPWYKFKKPTPIGPVIFVRLVDGFCGLNVIGVSRLPTEEPGKASWTAILAIFHEVAPALGSSHIACTATIPRSGTIQSNHMLEKSEFCAIDMLDMESAVGSSYSSTPWKSLSTRQLTLHESTTCIVISRTTLITLLILCNGRTMFRYSDASGHRAAYSSYCGHWYINWPLGKAAVANFAPHDSHQASTDVYPPMFRVRVDRCVNMVAGIVTSPDMQTFQCAFPGRKSPGVWVLNYQVKGFPGAHGSRHLYNQQGGIVYNVDLLLMRPTGPETSNDDLTLELPSTDKDKNVFLRIPQPEQKILERALDSLPWSSLSWSIHRGLRDILVAFAKPTMDYYRESLASSLRTAALKHADRLEVMGWTSSFVKNSMADLAANSVLAGSGNSGDSVRVVTDIALLLCSSKTSDIDETWFWRKERFNVNDGGTSLSADALIALIKVFVLEWSIDFDYQMYHDLPTEVLLR